MQALKAVSGTVAVLVVLVCVTGCETLCHKEPEVRPLTYKPETVDPWLVEVPAEMQIEKAVVRQHTLFPYHFVEYGAVLNELGRRDLDILIRHYRQYPGPLNIRRGDASDQVYQARVAGIRDALRAAGVDVQQVEMANAPAGGDGLAGDHVLVILQEPHQTSTPGRTVTVAPFSIQQGPQDSSK